MFCAHCGDKLKEGAAFCTGCGIPVQQVEPTSISLEHAVVPMATDAPQAEESTAPQAEESAAPQAEAAFGAEAVALDIQPPATRKKNRKAWLAAALAVVLVGTGGLFVVRNNVRAKHFDEQMAFGTRYLNMQDYTRATSHFEEALTLEPSDSAVVAALARAYMMQGEVEKAEALLAQHVIPESDANYVAIQKQLLTLRLNPEIGVVDAALFPAVTIDVRHSEGVTLDESNISITEGGVALAIHSFVPRDGGFTVTYEAAESGYEPENRTLQLAVAQNGAEFTASGAYQTPSFQPASISLISTDVSAYPVVKAYFSVEDGDGVAIERLDSRSFLIRERLQGGEYLAREVKFASVLEGNAGVNIDLVADKSDSIAESDMDKIKRVMIQFVNSLHYSVGDKAEVLAFDSIVQQMCYYTNDVSLLVHGINNMSTDGLTAFYDAVYAGINHAALQGGARCVIAFTDGMDNRSNYSANDVIAYANTNQVPVFIIGVGGSVEQYTLMDMAERTGGRYWHIDDLYDLEEIFRTIYAEQKKLYVVEYESDAALDAYLERGLSVSVSGGGYRGKTEMEFKPARTVNDNGGVQMRSSRYELIKEGLTWEQASQRCQEMGGHLATISSQSEMEELIKIAEAGNARYVWLGGYTSYDSYGGVFGHWVTGEQFDYQAWSKDEPSRVDQDGEPEWYIMLWNIPSLGGWSWNDQRNDPAGVLPGMAKDMAFICEFEI